MLYFRLIKWSSGDRIKNTRILTGFHMIYNVSSPPGIKLFEPLGWWIIPWERRGISLASSITTLLSTDIQCTSGVVNCCYVNHFSYCIRNVYNYTRTIACKSNDRSNSAIVKYCWYNYYSIQIIQPIASGSKNYMRHTVFLHVLALTSHEPILTTSTNYQLLHNIIYYISLSKVHFYAKRLNDQSRHTV